MRGRPGGQPRGGQLKAECIRRQSRRRAAAAQTRYCPLLRCAAGPRSQLLLLAGKSRAMRAKLYASCPNGRRSSGIHRQPDQRLTRFVVTSRPRSTSSRVCRGCFVAHIHMWSRQAAVILARRRSGHPRDGAKLGTATRLVLARRTCTFRSVVRSKCASAATGELGGRPRRWSPLIAVHGRHWTSGRAARRDLV